MKDKIFMLKPCIRCGGHAEFRHVKIKDLWYLIKFHLHPNQYYFICEICGAKIPSRHKIKLAINDWNEQN